MRPIAITGTTEVEVAVARVRRADFIISVRTRGTLKSAHSIVLAAPQVPGLRIVHLMDNGRPVKKGDVVVEFDAAQQEQNVIERTSSVRSADGDIEQLKATQVMNGEGDAMDKMDAEYGVERARLDASKPKCSRWWMAPRTVFRLGLWRARCSGSRP